MIESQEWILELVQRRTNLMMPMKVILLKLLTHEKTRKVNCRRGRSPPYLISVRRVRG